MRNQRRGHCYQASCLVFFVQITRSLPGQKQTKMPTQSNLEQSVESYKMAKNYSWTFRRCTNALQTFNNYILHSCFASTLS